MGYKDVFKYDVYRKLGKYNATPFDLFLNRDLKCIKIFRKANYYYNKNRFLYLFYCLKLKILLNKYDFNVPASTKIGYGLFIGHNGPIIINSSAIIGNNCNIATGVTIGIENRGKRKGTPTIGNKVWIGNNSTIVGKIVIGDDVLIAPNSFVNFDVPSHSIVIGNPGKIISRENATKDYVTNLVEM